MKNKSKKFKNMSTKKTNSFNISPKHSGKTRPSPYWKKPTLTTSPLIETHSSVSLTSHSLTDCYWKNLLNKKTKLNGKSKRPIKFSIIFNPSLNPSTLSKKESKNSNKESLKLSLQKINFKNYKKNFKTSNSNSPISFYKSKPSPNPCRKQLVKVIFKNTK